jgi:nicotinate-nucleotide--dimethylbenzimidazole phosphoribosyltransferase
VADTLGGVTEPAELPTLLEISGDIAWPDTDAEADTRARLIAGGLGERTLGRLGDLAIWLAGVQGVSPPREPRRPRLVLFAEQPGGIAVGKDAAGSTAGTEPNAVTHLFADVAGLSVRLVEVPSGSAPHAPSAPGGTDPSVTGPDGIAGPDSAGPDSAGPDSAGPDSADGIAGPDGAGPGSSDRLSAEAVDQAIRAGARAADDEIDAGADLLVVATSGPGGPGVDAVVSTMTLTEPVKVVGLDTAMSDAEWMTWVAAVRDFRLQAMPHRHEVSELLGAVGTTQLAAVTGFLLRAAARRTPLLLDGDVVAAATLLAREVTPNVVRWWQPGARSTSPAHALAMEEFGAVAVLDLELGLGAGVGGALAVPLLRAAARVVSELTGPAPAPPPDDGESTGLGFVDPDDDPQGALADDEPDEARPDDDQPALPFG